MTNCRDGKPDWNTVQVESIHAEDLLKLAYTAAADRLSEQRDRLEGLRTRASSLLGVASLVVSFAAGIGLFSTDASSANELPGWCLWSLFGTLMVVGFCTFAVLRPTRKDCWEHGPRTTELLGASQQNSGDALAVQARATKVMIEASNGYNERCLRTRGIFYMTGAAFLAVLLLLIIAGVAYQHAQHHPSVPIPVTASRPRSTDSTSW